MSASFKLLFEDFEKTLFSVLETESWPDTLFCIVAYVYVISLFTMAFLFPLSFFVLLFLVR